MKKRIPVLLALLALASFALFGCGSGSDGAAGAAGPAGPTGTAGTVDPATVDAAATAAVELAAVKPESCEACHSTAGADHQAFYNQLNKSGAAGIAVSNVTYAYAAGVTTVTFKMTKPVPFAGADFDCREADSLSIYWSEYNGATFPANPAMAAAEGRTALKGALAYDGAGTCTSTYDTIDLGNLAAKDGMIAVYGYDELVATVPGGRVRQVKYPFAAVQKMELAAGNVNYVSAANVAGCEKCHNVPYVKHGNILGTASGTLFYTCKACHLDDGDGGHFEWGLAVNDPALAASYNSGTPLTAAQEAEYAYKTTLMNDVHMSHAMEFNYPQPMANCVTCHAGKIAAITADAQFKLDTCKSCHPFKGTSELALPTLAGHAMPANGVCNTCHTTGGIAPVFGAIHSGYDKIIYAAANVKFKDIFSVAITSVTKAGNVLTIKFAATKTDPTSATTLAVTSIAPTVVVGLYGYDTKDFIVDAHGRDAENNRLLEYVVGATHPRFTTVSAAGGAWEVTADLTDWAAKIADGTVKRAEIVVLPKLPNADGVNVAVNSPSKTFTFATGALGAAGAADTIVKVAEGATVAAGGCDNCHASLGRTFHSSQYGAAGVVGCRLCHTIRSGGSHLEMQSRSIDSYVHAIHQLQPFDIQNVDFADPFTVMEYKLETGDLGATSYFSYPTFTTKNCTSCHKAGTFEVPDQTKSLAGTLSASQDTLESRTRNISGIASVVTGPAARACGACHRTMAINRDDAGKLTSFNQHTRDNGYRTVATDATVLDSVIAKIRAALGK